MKKYIWPGLAALLLLAIGLIVYAFDEPSLPRALLEAKYAAPPSQFVLLPNGARVHYRERGPHETPVLLLLHGSNSSLFDWEQWSKILSDRFLVVSVDLPGHGLTGAVPNGDYSEAGMTEFVKAFADQLGLKEFALAGNSMGGGVAARFAETYPERVTHLVLVDAHAWGLSRLGPRVPFAFNLAGIPVLNVAMLRLTPRSVVQAGLEDAVVRRKIINDAMIDQYWDFARLEGTRFATITRFRLPQDTYVRDHIARIKAPTLILWGKDDQILSVASAYEWKKAIPGSKLIVFPATGHLPMEEVPQKSADAVRSFISSPH